MLLCQGANDKVQVVTGQAVTTDVHVSGMDVDASAVVTTYRKNTAISTATTTDITAAPASGTTRNVKTINIRNKHATSSVDVTVQHYDGSITVELYKATLLPGYTLEYVEGVGWFTVPTFTGTLDNFSTASQSPFSSDTYLVGSNVSIPTGGPYAGSVYRLIFDVTKTALGTATPIVTVRYGTAGAVGDTSRCAFTFSAGTAATDTGRFDIFCLFRTVGSGTSAVIQGNAALISQPTTGLSSLIHSVSTTGGGFDSTVANSIIGASYNGGASAAHTVQLVRAELIL